MGKSIRSKRMKKLRTIKREKLMPRENILLEQRAAILRTVKGEVVDEATVPQLPEEANAIKRFVHTRDGTAPKVHTLASRYGYLANNNVCITKFNTLDALKEKYDTAPVKEEERTPATKRQKASKKATIVAEATRRRSGRDRTPKVVAASGVKAEGEESKEDADNAEMDGEDAEGEGTAAEPFDIDADQIRYGEFGKPAHTRKSAIRSKLSRKRSKSKGKGGFLNWHNMAASS